MFVPFLILASCWQAAAQQAVFTHGVASGEVTSSSAIVWTRLDRNAEVVAEVSRSPDFTPAMQAVMREHQRASADNDFTVKMLVEGLQPGARHYYRFRFGNAESPTGTFVTAPGRDIGAGVRFTWTSDTDGSFQPRLNQFEVLEEARRENADFFVYLGDTVYMDTNPPVAQTLPAMREKYKEVRDYPALRDLLASTSTYAAWDDHEISDDFSPATTPAEVFAAGRKAFEEYLPVPEWSQTRGYYRAVRWGKDVELFLLDERSFRSAPAAAACRGDMAPMLPAGLRTALGLPAAPPAECLPAMADPSRTMLGAAQKQEFLTALRASDATWKIIVSQVAVSLLFAFPYDRWEGYVNEREEILGLIRASGLKNVVVITGDLHANLAMSARSLLDGAPVVKEFIAGPVAQYTLLETLSGILGPQAAEGMIALLAQNAQADCLHAHMYGYGLLEVDAVTKTLTVSLKDQTGATFCESVLPAQ